MVGGQQSPVHRRHMRTRQAARNRKIKRIDMKMNDIETPGSLEHRFHFTHVMRQGVPYAGIAPQAALADRHEFS